MKLSKGDYCLLKGQASDICVRILGELEPWQGARRFLGEKLSMSDSKVAVRRAFFADDVLKVVARPELKRDELGLSSATRSN